MQLLFTTLLCLLLMLCPSGAVKGSFSKTSTEPYGQLLQETFGMAEGGIVSLSYSLTAKTPSAPYSAYFLILLLTENEREYWYPSLSSSSETTTSVSSLCTQPSWRRLLLTETTAGGAQTFNMTVTTETGSEQFSLAVLQCLPATPALNPVTLSLDFLMKNPRPTTPQSEKSNFDVDFLGDFSHLAINDVMLKRFYGGLLIVYVWFVCAFGAALWFDPATTRHLHWLFMATLIPYLLLCMVQYVALESFDHTGSGSFTVTMAIRVLVVITDTLSLASFFLLSLGWTVLRRSLTERELRIVSYAIGAYFIFSISGAGCIDKNNAICDSLDLVSFIIKSLLLLAIIIAMNFTVTQLRAMLNHSPWVPSTPLHYARCKQYQVFRIIFILYLLLPTAFLLVQVTIFSWKQDWVGVVANELLNVLLLFHIGVTFGPFPESFMLRAFDGSLQRNRAD